MRKADTKRQKESKTRKLKFWYTNIDTLTQTKHQEMIKLIEDKKYPPDDIALVEAKPKNSKTVWNPAWYKINNYNIESVNMNPNDRGRGILIFVIKDVDYCIRQNPNELQEMMICDIALIENLFAWQLSTGAQTHRK